MKRLFAVLGVLLGTIAVCIFAAFLFFLGITRESRLDPARLRFETQYVTLTGKDDLPLDTGERRSVPPEELPAVLKDAFVAVEDKRFYEHNGFDYRRIVKAALKNLATLSFREGASTISQQLIKNTHLSSEKTLTRKLKEVKLTRLLEKNYSKEEILGLYLNSIYFGHSAYGIADAAAFYFRKAPSELTPAECALLAALVRSPNSYSPFRHPDACLSRRNFVLKLMREQEKLTERQYREALEEPLPETGGTPAAGKYYFSLAKEELEELLPGAEGGAYGKLRVKTAYDEELQRVLESFAPETDIVALVREENGCLSALRTTMGLRERLPASTIKPLLVYGPALEEDLISPATPLLDARADFGGYMPDDAGGASGTYLSARTALARSVNIPAVRLLNSLGCERAASYLRRMDLPVEEEELTLALALGGMKRGYTLKALADGYACLADGGNFEPSGVILSVSREDGTLLYERTAKKERVFSEETAYLLTDMLKTAAKEGTAKKLRSLPYDVAAKTGTHEGTRGNSDAYAIAYTTRHVAAVWLGNADASPIEATGGGLPATYVKEILSALYSENSPPPFRAPEGVVRLAYDEEIYEREHRLVLADPLAPALTGREELFKRTHLPAETSTRFSRPVIKEPSIEVQNGTVCIVLCHADYYDYEVKRGQNGRETVIYRGPYRDRICDSSTVPGACYDYTVTPYYGDIRGESRRLPRVVIPSPAPPDDWWT